MARLFVLGGPDDGLGRVGEIAAREIGRRVGLNPGNVVEELETGESKSRCGEALQWAVPSFGRRPLQKAGATRAKAGWRGELATTRHVSTPSRSLDFPTFRASAVFS